MCLEITIIDDTVLEPEIETFEVNLSTEDPSVDIGPDTSVVTIVDNDCELALLTYSSFLLHCLYV